MTRHANFTALVLLAVLAILSVFLSKTAGRDAEAGPPPPSLPVIHEPFNKDFTITDLGVVPGFGDALGPLTFRPGEPDTLIYGLIVADDGILNTITVERDEDGHITGFSGGPTYLAAADGNDGGADFAPNGVLFVTTYGTNQLLQYKPGSPLPDKTTNLASIGIGGSVGALRFVPQGIPGAGQLKVTSYDEDAWYTVPYTENDQGTYDLGTASLDEDFGDGTGPESPVYVPQGLHFPGQSVLVAEYDANEVAAYVTDAGGDAIIINRRVVLSGDEFSPAGMVDDPVTGDLIIADYDNGHIYVLQGFTIYAVKGDLNCSGEIDGTDVVASIRYAAGADVTTTPRCAPIGKLYPGLSTAGLDNFVGDMNCDNTVDSNDTLALLRYLGGLPQVPEPPVGCIAIGSD